MLQATIFETAFRCWRNRSGTFCYALSRLK